MSVVESTPRRRREDRNPQTRTQVADLDARLIEAQEQERKRIGRELHDHVSQRLALLAITFERLHPESLDRAVFDGPLHEVREQIHDISADIHDLAHQLHPSPLESLDLIAALRRLAAEFSRRCGVIVRFACKSVPNGLAKEVALCLFRVAEEGLTNAARHGRARTVRVDVTGVKGGVRLRIADDGAGFDAGGCAAGTGLGLVSMRERLELVGGRFHITSVPARGTKVDVWVPHP